MHIRREGHIVKVFPEVDIRTIIDTLGTGNGQAKVAELRRELKYHLQPNIQGVDRCDVTDVKVIRRGSKTMICATCSGNRRLRAGPGHSISEPYKYYIKISADGEIKLVDESRAKQYKAEHGIRPSVYTKENQKKDDEYLKKIIEDNHSKIKELLNSRELKDIRGHWELEKIKSLLEEKGKALEGFDYSKRKDFRFSLDDNDNLVAWHKIAIIQGNEFTLGGFKVPKLAYIVTPDGNINKVAKLSERGGSEKDGFKEYAPELLFGSIDRSKRKDHKITPNTLFLKLGKDCFTLPHGLDWRTFAQKAAQILHNRFHRKRKNCRDLKPSNFLWVSEDERLYPIDFGLMNNEGFCGTPGYTIMDRDYHDGPDKFRKLDILALIITISEFMSIEERGGVKSPRLQMLLKLGYDSLRLHREGLRLQSDGHMKQAEKERKNIFGLLGSQAYTAENILSLLLIDEVNTKLGLSGGDLISDSDLNSDRVRAITALYQAGFEVRENEEIYRSILGDTEDARTKVTQICQTKQLQDQLTNARRSQGTAGPKETALWDAINDYENELERICGDDTTEAPYKANAFEALKMHRRCLTKFYNSTLGCCIFSKKLSTSHKDLITSGLER